MAYGATLPIHLKGVREVQLARAAAMPNFYKYIVGQTMNTTAIAERMVLMTGLATATVVGDGAGVSFDEITTPYDKLFPTEIYAIGVEFTEKQLKTDQSGKLKRFGEEFAYSLYLQLETMVADVLNNGTDATNFAGIDGVALFSATHPWTGGTWSNLSTAAALDATSLKQAVIDRKSHKTLKGQPWLKLAPTWLVTGGELEFTAEILVKSTSEAGTADNDTNVVPRVVSFAPGNQFITDTNAFYLIPKGEENPIFLLEGNLDKPIRQDYDPRTLTELMVAAQDHTTGWLYPAGVQGNAGA